MNIPITIKSKVATSDPDNNTIVCGNSDYYIVFNFDEEWSSFEDKIARFTYLRKGKETSENVKFKGNTVNCPAFSNILEVSVGVFLESEELHTSTPAKLLCLPSILCGNSSSYSAEDIVWVNKLLKQIGNLGELSTVSKDTLVAAINEINSKISSITLDLSNIELVLDSIIDTQTELIGGDIGNKVDQILETQEILIGGELI